MTQGGRSYQEELAYLARQALEKGSEAHNIVKLPCCGTGVEVTDIRVDTYGACPNPRCGKYYAILGNNGNVQLRSQNDGTGGLDLVW